MPRVVRAVLTEDVARRVAPVALLLVALCFLLPFVTVTRTTERVKPVLDEAIRSAGDATGRPLSTEGIDACLDALDGTTAASYSGLSLVTGSQPAVQSPPAAECPGSLAAIARTRGSDAGLGAQSLAAAALACVLIAAVLAAVPSRPRGLVVSLLSGVAAVLLILDQNRLPELIVDRSQHAVDPLAALVRSIPDFFSVASGPGYWLALTLLVAGALYNSAAGILTGAMAPRRPVPAPPPAPGG